MKIFFDMDGTLANFYGVKGWLECLQSENPLPYRKAEVRVNTILFSEIVNTLQKMGTKIGIITWTSKNGSMDFHKTVIAEKLIWLQRTFPEIAFDEFHALEYGTPKEQFCSIGDVLFDDEEQNRKNWRKERGHAFTEEFIVETLKEILKILLDNKEKK